MAEAPPTFRNPNPAYKGKNGFSDKVFQRPAEDNAMQVDSPPNANLPILAEQRKERITRDAIERHRRVDEILEVRGSYFPGMKAIKDELASEDTSANMKERIINLQKQHREEMNALYDLVAEDYLGEVEDAYYNVDDSFNIPEIDQFCGRLRRPDAPTLSSLYSTISEVRYAHCHTVQNLQRKRNILLKEEEAVRKVRDAQFPTDITAYHKIMSKDVQLRVARFLMSDTQTKDRMLTEFNWVWRQVKPLEDAYAQNADFRAEIQERVREVEVRDPRRKASTTLAA